jgi:hypothetical protein
MKADEWRTVYDSPFDVTRARDLLIESVGGEASEQPSRFSSSEKRKLL